MNNKTISNNPGNGNSQTDRRTFVTPDQLPVASAIVPKDFVLSASILKVWQSEMVPLTSRITATDNNGILLLSDSKELFHDVRNPFIRTIIALVPNHSSNGYTSFKDSEQLMREFVSSIVKGDFIPVSKTALPSFMAHHPDAALRQLKADLSLFDSFMEMPSTLSDPHFESILYRYEAHNTVIFAGMDYECSGLTYGPDLLKGLNLEGIKENVSKVIENSPSLNNFSETVSDVMTGKDKLTFSDMMKGGLIGKAMRRQKDNGNREAFKEKEIPEENKTASENRRRVDQITFGAYRKYACIAPAGKEKEALQIFLRFVTSLLPDPAMEERSNAMINQKMAQIRQAVAVNQSIVLQKQRQLQTMQMETSRKISEYSRSASEGLMDSWKKKMDSDSRISQARSEATMGVDTYTNRYGQEVSVSVGADHVYDNQYGDVYGVFGNAPDQDVLNDLKWTKIDDK